MLLWDGTDNNQWQEIYSETSRGWFVELVKRFGNREAVVVNVQKGIPAGNLIKTIVMLKEAGIEEIELRLLQKQINENLYPGLSKYTESLQVWIKR